MHINKEDNISCKKYQPIRKYSHLQEFTDNLPYIVMTFLGSIVLFLGIDDLFWRYISSGLYILYGIVGAFWIIIFVCPYCHYFDTRLCPCGYGQIAAKLRSEKDGSRFIEKFRKHIPVIVPLWIIPVVAGTIFSVYNFSIWMLTLIVLFILNSFIVLPLLSRKYGCAHCPQKDMCPWMTHK